MAHERQPESSAASEAYARAVAREQALAGREQQQRPGGREHLQADKQPEADDSIQDLYRQHSHQQSMEGG